MRDFFERQEAARKNTYRLIAMFFAAVLLIVAGVYAVFTVCYLVSFKGGGLDGQQVAFWSPFRFAAISGITLLFIAGGSLYKYSELKEGGGPLIAAMLGGRLVRRSTADPDEKRLLNVVEEMAIASGVPVPDVYLMEREGGINAFAAGHGTHDAVVSVTKGCLHLLSRDELQGVLAHEFSHILNGDMRMNIRLMGWLHGILLISFSGKGLVKSLRRVRGRGGAVLLFLGAALYALGAIGMFFGGLIKSAISRQREYLADASAVQFTRNPGGLAGALKKAGGLSYGSKLSHPRASETSHFYFCNGVGESLFEPMSTHPPLTDRIRRLEPSFDGIFKHIEPLQIETPRFVSPKRAPRPAAPVVVTGAVALAILETVGAPMKEHEELARDLISAMPGPLRMAASEPAGACALVYVLLLDTEREKAARQITLLKEFEDPGVVAEADTLAGYLPISPRLRLPLMDMAVPALRQLPSERYYKFRQNVQKLAEADGKLNLFEYILKHVLIRHLDAFFAGGAAGRNASIYNIRGAIRESSTVLSFLAHTGARDGLKALRSFEQGKRILAEPDIDFTFQRADECTLGALDAALNRLALTSPPIKRKLLAACLETVTFDREITVEEAELFRAVGAALDCPTPPWLTFAA